MNPLVGKIVIAAIIVISFIIITYTIISLFNKNERLRRRHKEAFDAAAEATRKINLLTKGDQMFIDRAERMMALSALEYVPFREGVELPETKHNVRQVYHRLREKLQILIKRDLAPEVEPKVKEDDETKEAPE